MNKASLPDVGLAVFLLVLSAVILIGTREIDGGQGYDRIGPQFFPYLTGFGLLVSGVVLLISALKGEKAEPATEEDVDPEAKPQIMPFVLISAGVILTVMLMPWLGFTLTAAVLFTLVAKAFNSQKLVRDSVMGLVFSGVIFAVFNYGLGLNLPIGKIFGGS